MYFYKIIDVVDFSAVNTPISTIALILVIACFQILMRESYYGISC